MSKKRPFHILKNITFSILFGLIFLEFLLRFAGWGFLFIQEQKNKKKFASQDIYRILCVGESTTALGGDNSYPSQLENLLNERSSNTFKVINKGIPGIGSSHIAQHLPEWISEYQPHIVIVMMGINDRNKLIPLDEITRKTSPWNLLFELRVYKLFSWVKQSQDNRHKAIYTNRTTPPIPASNSESTSNKNLDTKTVNILKAYVYAQKLIKDNKFSEAEDVLKKLKNISQTAIPSHKITYNLADTLVEQNKMEEFVNTIMLPLLRKNDQNSWLTTYLPQLCAQNKGTKEIITGLQFLITQNAKEVGFYEFIGACLAENNQLQESQQWYIQAADIRRGQVNPLIRPYYLEVAKTLRISNVKAIFMQYPRRDIKDIFPYITPENNLKDFYFIENKRNFETAMKDKPYTDFFTDRFAGNFGHATAKGNQLIAENAANFIIKNILNEN